MAHATNSLQLQAMEKLRDADNYSTWKFMMRMLLIHEDLWATIEETEKNDPELKKSQKALAKICLSVNASAFPHVRNVKTGS